MSEHGTGTSSGLGWPPPQRRERDDRTHGRPSGLGWPPSTDGDGDAAGSPAGETPAGADEDAGEDAERACSGGVSRETPPEQTGVASSPWRRLGSLTDAPTAGSLVAGRGPAPVDDSLPIGRQAAAAVRAARLMHQPLPRPQRTRVIVVANQKGGVGKTTTAVNIAAALALHGADVLAVDMDPQANASTALGLAHHADVVSTYDVLVEGVPLADAIQSCPDIPTLRGVPSSIDLAGADLLLARREDRELLLRAALGGYLRENRVDYVIIDCPPTLGLLTINALAAGLEVLIPIQCEYYALEGLSQLLTTIDLVRVGLNDALTVSHVLLTMYDGRTRLAGEVAAEVRAHFGDRVLPTMVPRSVRLSEAPGFGQTALTYAPVSPGALSYLEAARDIAHDNVQQKESA